MNEEADRAGELIRLLWQRGQNLVLLVGPRGLRQAVQNIIEDRHQDRPLLTQRGATTTEQNERLSVARRCTAANCIASTQFRSEPMAQQSLGSLLRKHIEADNRFSVVRRNRRVVTQPPRLET
jgi:hypothetical protein